MVVCCCVSGSTCMEIGMDIPGLLSGPLWTASAVDGSHVQPRIATSWSSACSAGVSSMTGIKINLLCGLFSFKQLLEEVLPAGIPASACGS